MRRASVVCSILLVASAFWTSTALAQPWPAERSGWTGSFGLGGGALSFDVADTVRTDREIGGFVTFGGGYGLHDHVVLGMDINVWMSSVNGVDWLVGVVAPYVAFYPGASGAYVRGGLGIGSADATYRGPAGMVETSDSGIGAFAAAGWEFRVLRTFAVHPELLVNYANLGSDVTATGIHFTTGMTWYWGQDRR